MGTPLSARRAARYRPSTPHLLLVALALVVSACGQSTSPTPSASASPTVAATSTPTAIPTATPLPTPEPLNSAMLDHRFTVLIVGEDVDAARRARGYRGDNTDAIMVVSASARQKKVFMVSLPRDNVNIPLANGQIWTGKVNAIANSYGMDALRQAMETLYGIDIPYYVKVNMDDFVDLVDAVGGINVDVKTIVRDDRWGLYLTPGRVHLDGRTALYYSRARYFDSDYARAARQQQVIHALAAKYSGRKTMVNLGQLLGTLTGLETNLPLDDLPTLIALARRAARAPYVAEVLTPPTYALGWGDQHDGRGWVIIPNVEAMRAELRRLISG